MTDERLAEIESWCYTVGKGRMSRELIIELTEAIRADRAKVAELQNERHLLRDYLREIRSVTLPYEIERLCNKALGEKTTKNGSIGTL